MNESLADTPLSILDSARNSIIFTRSTARFPFASIISGKPDNEFRKELIGGTFPGYPPLRRDFVWGIHSPTFGINRIVALKLLAGTKLRLKGTRESIFQTDLLTI